jgi:hypothetical protein
MHHHLGRRTYRPLRFDATSMWWGSGSALNCRGAATRTHVIMSKAHIHFESSWPHMGRSPHGSLGKHARTRLGLYMCARIHASAQPCTFKPHDMDTNGRTDRLPSLGVFFG